MTAWVITFREAKNKRPVRYFVAKDGSSARPSDARRYVSEQSARTRCRQIERRSRGYVFDVKNGGSIVRCEHVDDPEHGSEMVA